MTATVPDILARIVAQKELELKEAAVPRAILEQQAAGQERRDFHAALRATDLAIIAEIKKASPSRGILATNFVPSRIAAEYQKGGATALSVLTDRQFFQGDWAHLEEARNACQLPVIRKDFTTSEYHILEAAARGADAILLIAAILDEQQLSDFRQLAAQYRMAALVEVHDERELEKSLRSGAEIVGVNNRDLRSFQVHLDVSLRLAPLMPSHVTKVSESGIFTRTHVQQLSNAGFHAFLVGESLMKSPQPAEALRALCS